MTFRKVLFWLHLACGVVAGLAIGIMCLTGTVLAFEKELAAWGERDARRVQVPPAPAARLSIEEAQRRLREAFPDARPANMVVTNDPGAAFAFPGTRATAGYYVNPYTGEARQPQSVAIGAFMQRMIEWHRYLGLSGTASRPRGKWINGACNLAFCGLAITGLYLWMPRRWSWRSVKAVALFNWRLTGKARDFNWHNAIGLWSAPILIVLTLTAVPISFQWGGRVINSLTGTPPPAAPASGAGAAAGRGPGPAAATQPAIEIPTPPPGTPMLSQDALVAAVQKEVPQWKTITFRATPAESTNAGRGPGRDAGGNPAARPASATAATFTVRDATSWPRTTNVTVAVNPYTGEIARRSGYAELAPAAQVRAWTRFLHTGEAIGWIGQFIAGLACAGGCFLVWTGLALAWRRFFGKSTPDTAEPEVEPEVAVRSR
jgi:uncharacterized iron-regulated membrane protein